MGSTRRQRRREARRKEIVDAAMTLVREDGPDGLTIARLAKSVDAAVGAIYRYFDSKSQLIAALQVEAILAFADVLDERLDSVSDDEDASPELLRILAAFLAYPAFAISHPMQHGLIDASVSDPDRLLSDEEDASVQEVLNPVLARCAKLLDDAVEADLLSPGNSVVRTHVLWGGLHGVGHFRKRDIRQPAEVASEALALALITDLLRGWGCSGDTLDEALKVWLDR